MVKHSFDIKDTDPLLLFGVNDQNLQILTKAFETQLIARGGHITIEGAKEQVQRVEQVLRDMINTINRKGSLSTKDVSALVKVSVDGKVAVPKGEMPVIVYTPKGEVTPRTEGQLHYFEAMLKNDIVFAVGPAGTGKTYQAVAVAVAALKARQVDRLILTRPAVEAGERLGFLPGDLKEKIDPYLTPLYDALQDMLPHDKLRTYMEQSVIEIAPLAYMRGRTLSSAYVILDEAQNATSMQMKMFLTRLGVNSKAIITGDITQIDLPPSEESGCIQAMHILKGIDGIAFCRLDESDVVRHRLVKDILQAYQGYSEH
ncbi:MAG: PhoH family protein [Fidelibacterota bacterium]|nr:MAG: PhoH family protein [Candidatus Neomarinimicrobiota bacterium]